MRLALLLRRHQVACPAVLADADIKSLINDSRQAKAGALFFALPGQRVDGHDFVQSALEAGAEAAVIESDRFDRLTAKLRPALAQRLIPVGNIRRMQGELAATFFGRPSDSLQILGVTGTNGKTTVSRMVFDMLQAANHSAGLVGTLGAQINETSIPLQHTTPDSIELQQLLARMVRAGVKTVAMEVSSHALALDRVAGLTLDAAAFTSFSQDHLDFHGSMDAYFEAKLKILSLLARQENPGLLFVADSLDRRNALEIAAREAGVPVTFYGFAPDSTWRPIPETVEELPHQSSFKLQTQETVSTVVVSMPGHFNIENALAALALASAAGVDLLTSVKTLAGSHVPGRFETLTQAGLTVVVDFAHTPDALANVLRGIKSSKPNRIITVFGCGGDRDRDKRPKMGQVAAASSDLVIVTSDNPRSEDPNAILDDIMPGLTGLADRRIIRQVDRREAIREAIRRADIGDTVLIAGKGHEKTQEIRGVKTPFDDLEEARAALSRIALSDLPDPATHFDKDST